MLADLPEPERDALRMYYFDEMKLKAIGKVMGVSESRACQLCKKGLQRLRRRIAFPKAA